MGTSQAAAEVTPSVRWIRRVFLLLAWYFFLAIIAQVFLAGLAIFGDPVRWNLHREFGYTFFYIAIALLVLVFLARFPRSMWWLTILLVGDYVVHSSLPFLGEDVPAVGALHVANAFVLFWIAGMVALRSRAFVTPPLGTASAAS